MFRTSLRAAVAALASLLLLASGGLIASGAAADVVPGSSVDLTAVVSGPSTGQNSGAFTYTVTFSNNSLPDADGATLSITPPAGATGVTASCAASAGATCGGLTTTDASITGSVGDLPQNGIVTITVQGTFPASGTSVSTSATITPPAGVTELIPLTNESSVSTSLGQNWDFAVVKAASQSTINPGDTVRYTVTYTNVGASNTVAVGIADTIQFIGSAEQIFSGFSADLVGCTPSAGGLCPTGLADTTGDALAYGDIYTGVSIPAGVPTGGIIEIVYDVTFTGATEACGSNTTGSIWNRAFVLNDSNTANNAYATAASTPGQQACPGVGGPGSGKSQSRDQLGVEGDLLNNTYTVTFTNDGDEVLDSVLLRDVLEAVDAAAGLYSGFTADFVSCTPTGGLVCPAFTDITTPVGFPGALFSHTIDGMPAHSTMTVVYTITLVLNENPPCGDLQSGLIRNTASSHLTDGTVDNDPTNNTAAVTATTPGLEPCPAADLETTKVQSTSLIQPGDTIRYTVTHRNNGPATVPAGFQIRDTLASEGFGFFGVPEPTIVSCVRSDGECPELNTGLFLSGFVYLATVEEDMPAGSSITIVYDLAVDLAETPACGASQIGFRNTAGFSNPGQDYGPITGVADSNLANNKAVVIAAHACSDVTVNKTVSSQITQGGAPLSYTISVTNAGPAVAPLVHVSDPLPTAFVYSDVTCAATGAVACPTAAYDPATRELTADILELGDGDEVTFTVNGVAAALPGTYSNTATVSSVEGDQYFYDPNLGSNTSTVNFQINNTTSELSVTKVITGAPDAGLPADATFGGEVTCGTQPTQRWQVTIPAGTLTGTATPLTFYNGESCAVTEDSQSVPPPGYEWSDVIISPETLTLTDDAAVTVTNVLTLLAVEPTSKVSITKVIDGGPTAGLPTDSTFGGTVTCDAEVQDWTVTIPAGEFSGSALPLTFPTGTDCVITETDQSDAPAGYSWTAVEISPKEFTLVGDTQARVTNFLGADLPTKPEPGRTPPASGPSGLAFTGGGVAGGILVVSLVLLGVGAAVLVITRLRRA